ncbi:hypothetical protein QVD17_03332 [Tagetes erecta]|uniref:Uncharacterized protein n=1 Tax=Tagetes erecta TaxID=13708 RepID=A0AAD8P8K1_TARER|nr:hypothetical protein QVD17_03332 [Tagetes erecta]
MGHNATVKYERVHDRSSQMIHEPNVSSRSVLKLIWKKLKSERKKLLMMRSPLKHVQVSYDEQSYVQNFDQGHEWRNELDILSRSFSVQYTKRASIFV